jgi:hypothetical protein
MTDALPGAPRPVDADHFAALIVGVRDLLQTADWLRSQALPFQSAAEQLYVPASEAGGAGLLLVPA